MAIFSYKGLGASGDKQSGLVEADDEKMAARLLREQSILVLKIKEGDSLAAKSGNWRSGLAAVFGQLHPLRFFPITKGDLIMFFGQLSLMLRAGYTLVPALTALQSMQTKILFIRMLGRMTDALQAGASLSASMGREKKQFPPMMVQLIAIGEQSGNLDSILERLAENIEQSKDLKRQVVSALTYPIIVLLCSIGLVVYLVKDVIPKFAVFLSSRGSELPASTQSMMDISSWLLDYGLVISSVVGGSTFAILVAYTFKPGKRVIDQVLLGIPIVGKVILCSSMAQSGWSLSLCLRSGIPALDALRINAEAMANAYMREAFQRAADDLLTGCAFSKALERPQIPMMMRHMATIGERSGELEHVMHEVGLFYKKELSAKVQMISVMIEPVMILGVGGLVGFVYYSLFQAVVSASKGGM